MELDSLQTGLQPSELLHQIAFWSSYVTNESVKEEKSCIELPPESAQLQYYRVFVF